MVGGGDQLKKLGPPPQKKISRNEGGAEIMGASEILILIHS
jgi:hypothetical protein